jgi:serine/threonine-protein kinase RsbW
MGSTHLALALRRDPGEARRARSHVRRACRAFGAEVVATAELLTTELFSNALLHGAGPIRVDVLVDGVGVRVEVSDTSPNVPVVSTPAPDDQHGRGLLLVDALAQDWGVVNRPGSSGKIVWFALGAFA